MGENDGRSFTSSDLVPVSVGPLQLFRRLAVVPLKYLAGMVTVKPKNI